MKSTIKIILLTIFCFSFSIFAQSSNVLNIPISNHSQKSKEYQAIRNYLIDIYFDNDSFPICKNIEKETQAWIATLVNVCSAEKSKDKKKIAIAQKKEVAARKKLTIKIKKVKKMNFANYQPTEYKKIIFYPKPNPKEFVCKTKFQIVIELFKNDRFHNDLYENVKSDYNKWLEINQKIIAASSGSIGFGSKNNNLGTLQKQEIDLRIKIGKTMEALWQKENTQNNKKD